MAIVNISIDTNTKTYSVDIDGKKIEKVSSINFYDDTRYDYYTGKPTPSLCLNICGSSEVDNGINTSIHYSTASDKSENKESFGNYIEKFIR